MKSHRSNLGKKLPKTIETNKSNLMKQVGQKTHIESAEIMKYTEQNN